MDEIRNTILELGTVLPRLVPALISSCYGHTDVLLSRFLQLSFSHAAVSSSARKRNGIGATEFEAATETRHANQALGSRG